MILGFTGSRKDGTEQQIESVESFLRESTARVFVHGCCRGWDRRFHKIVRRLKPDGFIIGLPGDEGQHEWAEQSCDAFAVPVPYLERNKRIVRTAAEMLACPGTMEEELRSGTWATVRYARKARRRLILVWPDGKVEEENA
jgi:SAM-dependent methyltransferase